MISCSRAVGVVVWSAAVLWAMPSLAGTWTKIAHAPPAGIPANATMLTDGRLLISGAESSSTWNEWWTIAPDSTGVYVNSQAVRVGDSAYGRLFNPSFTLNTGQYMVCGGEYICPPSDPNCGQNFSDRSTCEVFDPVSNSWSQLPDVPEKVDDSPAVVLADGRVLILTYGTGHAYLFSSLNPTQWTQAASYNTADANSEAGSALLPDGSVFIGNHAFGRYSARADSWTEAASTATISGGTQYNEFISAGNLGEGEIGAFLLLYDGTVLVLGSNAHNGIYNLGDSWSLTDDSPVGPNPSLPYNHGDSPGCVEPDGNVLTIVNNHDEGEGSGSQSAVYEYGPGAASGHHWTLVSNPPVTSGLATASDRMKMVALPTGQILVTGVENNGTLWLYNPAGTPNSSWRPSITQSPYLFFGAFVLNGPQLNGLTSGSDFGDDQKSPTNYPIVTFKSSGGAITFAKTFGFDQRAPQANRGGSCLFTIPSLASGNYTVNVTTNGVASANTVQVALPATDEGPALLASATHTLF